jgi:hypothetical protein
LTKFGNFKIVQKAEFLPNKLALLKIPLDPLLSAIFSKKNANNYFLTIKVKNFQGEGPLQVDTSVGSRSSIFATQLGR